MDCKEIKKALQQRFSDYDYLLTESYIFKRDWESDFFVMSKSGYAYEIEIKVSRADFRADFKKPKHQIFKNIKKPFHIINRGLSDRWYDHGKDQNGRYVSLYAQCTNIDIVDNSKVVCPNRFYYAVPTGLVVKDEIPDYAGLLYINRNGSVTTVKDAPFLHKRKLDLTKTLLAKFYWECLSLRRLKQ